MTVMDWSGCALLVLLVASCAWDLRALRVQAQAARDANAFARTGKRS